MVARIGIVVLACVMAVSARDTSAAPTFSVNSTADAVGAAPLDNGVCETATGNGICTLRAAIMKANHYPGGGVTIRLGVATYTLGIPKTGSDGEENGDLNIDATMTITGSGVGKSIVDGNGAVTGSRVFRIGGSSSSATVSSVTIRNGRSSEGGGGIFSSGLLTLNDAAVVGNTAAGVGSSGGGILSVNRLTLNRSVVSGNATTSNAAQGGGIFCILSLTIADSTIADNTTPGTGGGVYHGAGTVTITGSTVSNNSAALGGGIHKGDGTMNVVNSTVSGNKSDGDGGGLYVNDGTTRLYNVTVTANIANNDGVGVGVGGGIYADASATVVISHSIIGRNALIENIGGNKVADNDDCRGTLTSQGFNDLFVVNSSRCTVNGPYALTDPNLGPLGLNGGRTRTHVPTAASQAIGAGSVGGCPDHTGTILTVDQRGLPRTYPPNGRCDLGAVEAQPFNPLDVDGSAPTNKYDALTDGLLVLRYLFGLTGQALTQDAITPGAVRGNDVMVTAYLDANRTLLDVDGDGNADALTDGILILRYLFSFRGDTLIQGAVAASATRMTSGDIEAWLSTLTP